MKSAVRLVTTEQPESQGQAPHDLEAEACVLAACMLQDGAAVMAMSVATPDDYYSGIHREVATAVMALLNKGLGVDVSSVAMHLRSTGRMGIVGSSADLVALIEKVPAIGSRVDHFANRVRDLARLRKAMKALRTLEAEAGGTVPDIGSFLARVDKTISDVTQHSGDSVIISSLESAKEFARSLAAPKRVSITTGFRCLDALVVGLEEASLYILGGRTGMGKTAMALQVCIAAAQAGSRVLYVSLEMSSMQLARRVLCRMSGVPLARLKSGLSPMDMSRLTHISSDYARLPLSIAPKTQQTILDIKSAVRISKPNLLVVDHIGLVESGSSGSRERDVASVSRSLKALALETGIPILALCQVGRGVAKEARRPTLADLRESGSIEQDADGVWLIHRPAYYDPRAPAEVQRQGEVIVAKQRDGETGILEMEWDGTGFVEGDPS